MHTQLINQSDDNTLLEVKAFPDLATMLRTFMGPRSARVLAELSNVDPNAIVRALRGLPMPTEAADKLIKFFRMDIRQAQEFRDHVLVARAYGHKAVREYITKSEKEREDIERLLLRLARSVPMSGQISADQAHKLREIAILIIRRHETLSDS